MADKKAKATDKKAKSGKPGFFARIKKYFRDTAGEFRKIVWPSRKTVINNTIVVLATVVVFAVVVGLLDFGFNTGRAALIDWIVKLAGGANG